MLACFDSKENFSTVETLQLNPSYGKLMILPKKFSGEVLRCMRHVIGRNHSSSNLVFRRIPTQRVPASGISSQNLKGIVSILGFELFHGQHPSGSRSVYLGGAGKGTMQNAIPLILQELTLRLKDSFKYRIGFYTKKELHFSAAMRKGGSENDPLSLPALDGDIFLNPKIGSNPHLNEPKNNGHFPMEGSEQGVLLSSEELTEENIMTLCTNSRRSSISLQQSLDLLDNASLETISNIFLRNLNVLLFDKYASYVLQRLVTKYPPFLSRLERFIKQDFFELIHNEYSSRILQALILHSTSFQIFTREKLRLNPEHLLQSIPSVFLIATAIRINAQSSESDQYSFLVSLISSQPSMLDSKYYKRVLVSIAEVGHYPTLTQLYAELARHYTLMELLEDKYLTYILLMYIQRDHPSAVNDLLDLLKTRPQELFRSKFFGFLVTKMIERDRTHPFIDKLHSAFANNAEKLSNLLKSRIGKDSYYFFFYVLLHTLPKTDSGKQPTLSVGTTAKPRSIDY